MDRAYFPVKTIVPSTEITQDRVMLELFRGCIRGCRFCQAGYRLPPCTGRRSPGTACPAGHRSLPGLRLPGDDPYRASPPAIIRIFWPLCDGLLEWCEPHKVNLALPSLRADNFSMELMERLQRGWRKSGLTFAPEAGSQRLRDAINKNVTEEDLLNSCRTAFCRRDGAA